MAAEIVQVSQVAQRSVGEGVGRGVGVVGCVGQGGFFQNGLMQTRSDADQVWADVKSFSFNQFWSSM